jgi:hypothetical protein
MSIFGRFRRNNPGTDDEWLRTDAVRWEPLYYAISRSLRGPAADMDDGSQHAGPVGRYAFETIFTTTDVPGAEIAVCTYVVEYDEAYWVGVRYTYTTTASPGWSYIMWDHDPYERPYPGAMQATEAARVLAVNLGESAAYARAMFPGIFDWDGQRFDMSIHASEEE